MASGPLPSPAPPGTLAENYADSAASEPNFVATNIPGFTVNGDIDRLYSHPKAAQGSGQISTENVYRICTATNAATGSSSTVMSVYGCLVGDTCVKKSTEGREVMIHDSPWNSRAGDAGASWIGFGLCRH